MRAPLADRFTAKVRQDKNGCWIWTGSKNNKGYGLIGLGGRQDGKALAHRVSWTMHRGPIPDDQCVLHRYDTPACVNPEHLFLGSKRDNTRDMMAKGRAGFGKLSNDERAAILVATGTNKAVADLFGVSKSQIGRLRGPRPHVAVTECKFGHSLSGYNLIVRSDGARACRECGRRRNKAYKQKIARNLTMAASAASRQAATATAEKPQANPNISAPAENKGALTLAQAVAEATGQFDQEAEFFAPSLPPNISLDRFKAVVVWALNENPDLLRANRRSLLNACAKAANDGLLPDKKEGALVVFNTNERRKIDGKWEDNWIKKVQWMPMVYGITKKALASGAVFSLYAMVVYENEIAQGKFHYKISDGHHRVDHEPILVDEPGKPVLAYAVAILANGVVEVQPMRLEDIVRVQKVSKSKDKDGNPSGPWKDWWDEMWKKSAIRRLSKRIPFPADVEQVIRRDDDMVDLDQDDDKPTPIVQNITQAGALMGSSGVPSEPPAQSEPVVIEGEIIDEGEELPDAETVEVSAPAEDPVERVKREGREAAAWGTNDLAKWWKALPPAMKTQLEDYKDSTLKHLAAQNDGPKR